MRSISLCLITILSLILTPSCRAGEELEVVSEVGEYTSGGKSIKVETFTPKAPGKHPAVLLLHGSDGLFKRLKDFQEAARLVAGRGIVVHLVYYFDRTGTKYADEKEIKKNFLLWVKTVHDGVLFAASHPASDPERIGLIGYSLGGYVSMSSAVLAINKKYRVKVIVEFFGGLPAALQWNVKNVPPTLILHGEDDKMVPVKEAHTLAKLLDDAKVPYEMKLFKGEGHLFRPKAARMAIERSIEFLGKHLAK